MFIANFFGLITFLAALAGGAELLLGFVGSQSAPQQAAAGALGIGLAVIPYVAFRVVQTLSQNEAQREFHQEVLKLLREREEASRASTSETPPNVAPAPIRAAKIIEKGGMGVDGWRYGLFDDGSVIVKDAHGGTMNYPSIEAARNEITWWTSALATSPQEPR